MPVKGIHSFYFVFANKFMWKFVNYIKLTRIVNKKLFCELTVQVTTPHSFEVSPKRNTLVLRRNENYLKLIFFVS